MTNCKTAHVTIDTRPSRGAYTGYDSPSYNVVVHALVVGSSVKPVSQVVQVPLATSHAAQSENRECISAKLQAALI